MGKNLSPEYFCLGEGGAIPREAPVPSPLLGSRALWVPLPRKVSGTGHGEDDCPGAINST